MPSLEPITVATYETAIEAWIFCNRLKTNGIKAFVADEHVVNMDWMYSNAIGGVKVQIAISDLERFREFANQSIPPVSELLIQSADISSDKPVDTLCQNCGSGELSVSLWSKRWTYVLWIIHSLDLSMVNRHARRLKAELRTS